VDLKWCRRGGRKADRFINREVSFVDGSCRILCCVVLLDEFSQYLLSSFSAAVSHLGMGGWMDEHAFKG